MKERFQVKQHRVFTCCNQVLVMEVGRFECIQKCQVAPLAFKKTLDLIWRYAAFPEDELHPPVTPSVEDFQSLEWRPTAAIIQPAEEFLEVHINGHRSRLVDHFKTGTERRTTHGSATSMLI